MPEALSEGRVKECLPLVRAAARRFAGRGMPMEDLVQTGAVGLVRAAQSYCGGGPAAFSTYAFAFIVGEIRHALRENGQVKAGRRVKAAAFEYERLISEGAPKESAAAALGFAPEELECLLAALEPCAPLEAGCAAAPDDVEKTATDRVLVRELLRALDPAARRLVELRFFDCLTQKEAAQKLGMGQAQASRAEKKALLRLRAAAQGGETQNIFDNSD